MLTYTEFTTREAAENYRRDNGTGGWIFVHPNRVLLFPPSFTPSDIFAHPITRGIGGELI